VFGDGKTAIKGGLNKYMRRDAGSFAKNYNPLRAGGVTTDTRDWFDCTLIPGTSTCYPALIGAPGYHDGIVEATKWARAITSCSASAPRISFAGNMSEVAWDVPISVFPNSQRTQSTLVPLTAPGTRYLERWNQLDISGRKDFRRGRYTFTPQIDLYNALNGAAIQTEITTFGPAQGKPQTILNGRLLRLVAQVKW
jgi:hypothetical protein